MIFASYGHLRTVLQQSDGSFKVLGTSGNPRTGLVKEADTDVAVIDTHDHFVEILTFAPDESLIRATKFRVFPKKRHDVGEHEKTEPSWITIADVTHDGNDDLILIAHDRILLYPGL